MPLPSPKDNEEKNEFISRCMSDEGMNKEFKNGKQKIAVCFSLYEKNKTSKAEGEALLWDEVKNDGYTLS